MSIDRRRALCAVLAVLVSAGCTAVSSESEASPAPISSSPAPGAELVCGVSAADLALVTGYAVARARDGLTVADGVGSGSCDVLSDDIDGALMVVRMYSFDDPEALRTRAALDGEQTSLGAPNVHLDRDTVDGGVWGGAATPDSFATSAPRSRAFLGETMVEIYVQRVAPYRTASDELLAMTFQVAQSYGLERPDPEG